MTSHVSSALWTLPNIGQNHQVSSNLTSFWQFLCKEVVNTPITKLMCNIIKKVAPRFLYNYDFIKNWGCQFSTGTTWEFNRFVPERARNFTFWRDVLLPLGIYSEEILPAPKNWATLPLEGARANFWVAVHELCCSLAIGFRTNKLTYEIMLCPDLHIL